MTVIFVDGRNIVCRFGYVFRHLAAEDGTKTGAVYGILQCLMRLKGKFPGSRLVIAWDGKASKEKGWRRAAYPQYKANRTGGNEEMRDLIGQLPLVHECLGIVGVDQFEIPQIEADDLISVMASASVKAGHAAIIYSSDQDYLQLLQHGVQVIPDIDKTTPLAFASAKTIQRKFGCTPGQLLTLRAIIGDSSDNIAGAIKGVGPKTALKMLAQKSMEPHPRILENYELMRLPLTTDDKHFTANQVLWMQHWSSVLLTTDEPVIADYAAMLDMCGRLSLRTAMERRKELWELHQWTLYNS